MNTYDDKTKGVIASSERFILPSFKPCNNATFKASYIVASDVKCNGKITALFDLIVLGSVEAAEIDIKGRFVCLGNCEVSDSIIVQNEIWANDIRAEYIETHDRIVAQEIDGGTIVADGSIVAGKILAVEKLAKSEKNILCGETAYGAGRIAANTIITGEPLDLDDGEEAVISPNTYRPIAVYSQTSNNIVGATDPVDLISYGKTEYAPLGNVIGYLEFLTSASCDDRNKAKFSRWCNVINEAEAVYQSGISEFTNVAMLIWLVEIAGSSYFEDWDKIYELFDVFEDHFKSMVQMDRDAVGCVIENYNEWLDALSILCHFGDLIDNTLNNVAFELVMSNLGLKAKFVSERLNEKGWEAHVE